MPIDSLGDTEAGYVPPVNSGQSAEDYPGTGKNAPSENTRHGSPQIADRLSLNPDAQRLLRELQRRDAEVRAHEQAHLMTAGAYAAGGANYQYQKGPDGREYAVGGHVNIDVSAESDNPEASLAKAGQIRRAALAPSEPSARDLQVAAKAAALEAKAQQQIQKQERAVHSQTPAADNAGLTADTASASGIPHTRQLRRAIDIYHSTAGQTGLPTALAPYGTGISLTI